MTQEDIIRMAREANVYCTTRQPTLDAMLERFAALVAAAEQKKWEDQTAIDIHEAILDEREACAGLAENRMLVDENKNKRIGHYHACKSISTDIRARGQA